MLILRIIAILSVIAIAGGFLVFVMTGQRRYLAFFWSLLKYSVIVALILFALMGVERLLVVPL